MPILGLFNSDKERKYQTDVEDLAKGRQTSQAVQGIQQDADASRRTAFAQAYSQRGNAALAQRQAQSANADVSIAANQQMATQRASDQATYRAEDNRLEAQRQAGIHNAIGAGVQAISLASGGESQDAKDKQEFEEWKRNRDAGVGGAPRSGGQQLADAGAQGGLGGVAGAAGSIGGTAMGGPLGGMLGGAVGSQGAGAVSGMLGGGQQPAGTPPVQSGQAQGNTMGGAATQSLVAGPAAAPTTAPSAQGQSDVSWATEQPITSGGGMSSLYDRPGLQRDPATDDQWRNGMLLSDQRMKTAAENGNQGARAFLDAYSQRSTSGDFNSATQEMVGAAQQLNSADLQRSADKAIQMAQPEGFTGDSVDGNESKDWERELFDQVEPQEFEYTPEGQAAGGAPGPQLGVMAQDVAAVAPQMVRQDPQGNQRIDTNQALSASLAAQANLNQRLNALEGSGDPLEGVVAPQTAPSPSPSRTPAVAPPRPRVDLYNRPGNQRSPAADRPAGRRGPVSAEERRYQENSAFIRALRGHRDGGGTGDEMTKRDNTPQGTMTEARGKFGR